MELRHVLAKDEVKSTVIMMLYGTIGKDFDGHQFAKELTYLSDKYDEITIRVNSDGGSVIHGLSIFTAILNSKAYVNVNIDGVAASMAGVIPMAADNIKMNDFARIMVHLPFYPDKKSLNAKEQKSIENLGAMLTDILSRRGMAKEKMTNFLTKETWFKADEALNENLIDEIIYTGKAPQIENSLTEIAAHNFIKYLETNTTKMNVIASLFDLQATATEAEIVGKIKDLQNENEALKEASKELKEIAATLKAEKDEQIKNDVEALTDKAISAGYFAKEQKIELMQMGLTNYSTFKSMIEGLKPAQASLSAAIAAAQATGGEEDKKDFEWYRRNDPHALLEMKNEEPEKFKKLALAWEKENN